MLGFFESKKHMYKAKKRYSGLRRNQSKKRGSVMNDEEKVLWMFGGDKMLWMFNEGYGSLSGSMKVEVHTHNSHDDDVAPEDAVRVMKDGTLCWQVTKTDLIFEYLTKHLL